MKPLAMADPLMIIAQNKPQSFSCMILKVKVHFFLKNGGFLKGLLYQKGKFSASKMYPRHFHVL